MHSAFGADTHGGPRGWSTQEQSLEDHAFTRLWQAFMTARVGIAAALLLVHGAIYGITKANITSWGVVLCAVYLAATLLVRLMLHPRPAGPRRRKQWRYTIAVDVLMYASLELMQIASINYTPLFALPVMLASVLGSLRLAVSTAASVTLLLLVNAWWLSMVNRVDLTAHFLQAGLTGAAYFALALLVQQLSLRLLREERKSRQSAASAQLQRQVNEVIIESLGDGVLVVDAGSRVRVANPSALQLLMPRDVAPNPPFDLTINAGWSSLSKLSRQTFARQSDQRAEITVQHGDGMTRRLQVRTRLTPVQSDIGENLCVMFLQDLREMEARLRTEKLAAMGRMSTAVAHEIRNPLAAISQANELLSEDLSQPAQQRLSSIVRQNTRRLGKIVDEILNVARVKNDAEGEQSSSINLDESIRSICHDWSVHSGSGERLLVQVNAKGISAFFDTDHLRRVVENLLDNAVRYSGPPTMPILVHTEIQAPGRACLTVWSEGAPLEATVEQHLFEPFFSSQSRSSGLGLYICRELCERHQSTITYRRVAGKITRMEAVPGNEFSIVLRTAPTLGLAPGRVSFRPSTF